MTRLCGCAFVFVFGLLTSLSSHADFVIEAEHANRVTAPFKVFANSTASGGRVVARPKGSRGSGTALFNLNVTEPGTYILKARVYAENLSSNSFVVQLDNAGRTVWNLPTSDSWQVIVFPQEMVLQAGMHSIKIFSREPDVGLDRIEVIRKVSISNPSPNPPTTGQSRGLWVWTTSQVLSNGNEADRLIEEGIKAKMTDMYLFLRAEDYVSRASELRRFVGRLSAIGIKAWGLEGYRGYFSDSYGPSEIYRAVDQLIAFNAAAAPNERLYGFHSDMEPQDGQGAEYPSTFHNGLPDSMLDRVAGGVWYPSQAEDREMLMRDWLAIHHNLKVKLKAQGLKFAASMPSWTDDYYGEEVSVTWNGSRQGVMKHMMEILDEYVVMSYNTDPVNAANRALGEVRYADTLPVDRRPRVLAGVETHLGPGPSVSYGDHAIKNSKSAVLSDIEIIKSILGRYQSYQGTDIHDWEGWRDLRP